MLVSARIESLLNKIDKGPIKEGELRGELVTIHDYTQSQETELEKANADLKQAEKRITELEVKLYKQQPQTTGNELEDNTKRLLKFFFDNAGGAYLEDAAASLSLVKSMADYHFDILNEAGFVELAGITPFGAAIVLTAKGRAYVVKNKIA